MDQNKTSIMTLLESYTEVFKSGKFLGKLINAEIRNDKKYLIVQPEPNSLITRRVRITSENESLFKFRKY